ncbi:RNA polymerase sigma factor [Pararcticibacter amylolyticus]|uniref:RNA polymerase subunit sigma-70 n=1 Tax=Pararcticibacter amylolyticus TaxID=2173175 RepID=A0A2U2PFP8_9SPHI|nr:RNA polymerase sigma-70 factor [Pararcticibacter amylolyticus]PWG80203.1 RNA polymerase subunit sigma-70 [Pararcticibacter amylolyticus]
MVLSYEGISDAELTLMLRNGDHAAYTEIYNRYWHVLYIHAARMLQDRDEAMDVVQDIFTTIWNRSSDLQIYTSIKTYLYVSVRNQILKFLSRSKLHDKFVKAIAENYQEGMNVTDEALAFNEFSRLIEKEIANLPPRMQEIFLKSRVEGLSHREIAEDLGVTEHTVKTTIYRTLKLLRSKLTTVPAVILAFWLSQH